MLYLQKLFGSFNMGWSGSSDKQAWLAPNHPWTHHMNFQLFPPSLFWRTRSQLFPWLKGKSPGSAGVGVSWLNSACLGLAPAGISCPPAVLFLWHHSWHEVETWWGHLINPQLIVVKQSDDKFCFVQSLRVKKAEFMCVFMLSPQFYRKETRLIELLHLHLKLDFAHRIYLSI